MSEEKGKCDFCRYFDGTYCCGGYCEDDLTIEQIQREVREAEEKGYFTDWEFGKCQYWEAEYDDSFEDVAFDMWRERYEE